MAAYHVWIQKDFRKDCMRSTPSAGGLSFLLARLPLTNPNRLRLWSSVKIPRPHFYFLQRQNKIRFICLCKLFSYLSANEKSFRHSVFLSKALPNSKTHGTVKSYWKHNTPIRDRPLY